jgi:glycosyltransferase involved in cell wall biosynthesis
MAPELTYVLITPARNEETFIAQTIESVVSQTVRPLKWVIVSDGSTDRTDMIVQQYLRRHSWLELVRMPEHRDRQFAAKVQAFDAGWQKLKGLDYDIIGNLDADITFNSDYFAYLLNKFFENPNLGVAGTPFVEGNSHYDYRYTNIAHVSGACQLFRRQCFEEIGGYTPIKGGGIDWTAVTSARMKGWKTQTFIDMTCRHHRKMGTGNSNELMSWFRHGRKDYYLGGHPLWQVFRSVYQMTNRPYIIGGMLLMAGYTWGFLRRMERPVSKELMTFYRKEQMVRLKSVFIKGIAKD